MSQYKYGTKRNSVRRNNNSAGINEALSCIDDELDEIDGLFYDLNSISQNVWDRFDFIKESVFNLKTLQKRSSR